MRIYPEITVTNERGNQIRTWDRFTYVDIWVNVATDRQSEAEIVGQLSVKVLRIVCRSAPIESWARIVFRNEEWDIAIPPTISHGISRATRHVEFLIRSRNEVESSG